MLVAKKNRKLVLNLKNPERVLGVIPTARKFKYKGKDLVAVPHRNDETKILRNLGFDPPEPIRHYYDWPGQYTPFGHQIVTAEFLNANRRAFCLNGMGTSKTLATLWAYDFLRREGLVNKMLVVAPLSTLERTWGDEIFMHFMHLSFAVLHGTREKRRKLLDGDYDIYIINHDGLKTVLDMLSTRQDIDLIIVDEIAQAARNASTDRWKNLNELINKQFSMSRWAWGLTGTPIPNDPTDAWAQCRLINPTSVPPYFGRFRDTVMRQVSQFKWVARDDAIETVYDVMVPAIRFAREDCLDLPPTMYETRHVDLTAEQERLYKDMTNKLKAEAAAGSITAVNEAVKMNKLVQICCGVAYDDHHEEVDIPSGPRIEVVKEVIGESEGKVIVFVPLTGALHKVARELETFVAKKFYGPDVAYNRLTNGTSGAVETINGSVSKSERDRIFQAFQKEAFPRVIVAQASAMSHGLTLTAANTIIWYAPITSNDTYEQANARIVRPSQTRKTLIVHIEGSEVERRIYNRLKNKSKVQNLLLDMFKTEK